MVLLIAGAHSLGSRRVKLGRLGVGRLLLLQVESVHVRHVRLVKRVHQSRRCHEVRISVCGAIEIFNVRPFLYDRAVGGGSVLHRVYLAPRVNVVEVAVHHDLGLFHVLDSISLPLHFVTRRRLKDSLLVFEGASNSMRSFSPTTLNFNSAVFGAGCFREGGALRSQNLLALALDHYFLEVSHFGSQRSLAKLRLGFL